MSAQQTNGHGVMTFIHTLKSMGVYSELQKLLMMKYGATLQEVYGQSRTKHVSDARHEAMLFIRDRFQWSYPAIGKLFSRDHTTVLASVKRMQEKGVKT